MIELTPEIIAKVRAELTKRCKLAIPCKREPPRNVPWKNDVPWGTKEHKIIQFESTLYEGHVSSLCAKHAMNLPELVDMWYERCLTTAHKRLGDELFKDYLKLPPDNSHYYPLILEDVDMYEHGNNLTVHVTRDGNMSLLVLS